VLVDHKEDCSVESLEVSIRILNNDLVGFSVTSQSTRKNWVVVGLLVMAITVFAVKTLWPIVEKLGIV